MTAPVKQSLAGFRIMIVSHLLFIALIRGECPCHKVSV